MQTLPKRAECTGNDTQLVTSQDRRGSSEVVTPLRRIAKLLWFRAWIAAKNKTKNPGYARFSLHFVYELSPIVEATLQRYNSRSARTAVEVAWM